MATAKPPPPPPPPHLLQVLQTLILPLHDGAHSSQCGLLELLTAVEGVAKLQQTHVVLGYVIDEVLGGVELPQGQLVVVFIVEDVQKIGVERVNVVQFRKLGDYSSEFIVEGLLGELDLLRVELPDS